MRFIPRVAQATNRIEGIFFKLAGTPIVVQTLRVMGTYDPKILVKTTQSLMDKLHRMYIKYLNLLNS